MLETTSLLKKDGKEIVKPLTDTFNLSLSTGIVPDKLKAAKVIPIQFKWSFPNWQIKLPMPLKKMKLQLEYF